MSREFKVTLSLKKQPNDEVVYYKVDGGRFDNEKTLKLNANGKYVLEFSLRPPTSLDCLNVMGGNVELKETESDEIKTTYIADWSAAGFDVDKRGKRRTIPIILEIRGVGTLKTNLQCKFYAESDSNHVTWGTMLSYIEFDCKQPEGSTYIDLMKETYR